MIQRHPDLEDDVQDVFIAGIKLIAERKVLEVANEKGGVFERNLETLEVKTLRGQPVISAK